MVNTSLFTGLSGLRSHQRYIDVIGNNLANVSTPGFWGSRATFSDLLSFTLRPGSGPNASFGGQNPMQIGVGASLSSIDLRTTQGSFQDTGRPLDAAIQGKGFFTLTDGNVNFFTRVGTFGVDSDRSLIDVRTGFRVLNSSGTNITVPVTDTLPPQATGSIQFQGNLPAVVTGPLEEIVQSSAPLLAGTAATRTAVPTTGTTYNISAFIDKTVLVAVDGGAKQTVTFPSSVFGTGNSVTAGAIAARFQAVPVQGLTVTSNDTTGEIVYSTNKLGSSATLKFDDGTGASGFLAVLGLNAALATGTQQAATAATSLNGLTSRNVPYGNGDQITISGTNPNGTPFSDTFVFGTTGTTVGSLISFIDSRLDPTQADATLAADGTIRVTATNKAEATLSLFVGDATGNVGSNNWPSFSVTQDGKGPDVASTSIDVIDSLGRTHAVTLKFTRSTTDSKVWDMTASMPAADGVVNSGSISTIRFNPDGSFNVIGGGTDTLTFTFAGIGAAQNVRVNLGSSGQFDGVALLGSRATVAATDQDGFTAGNLLNVAFDTAGRLVGYYSNGSTRTIATLRISVFPNEGGLLRTGDTMFVQSPNSDEPIATTADAAGAGTIRPSALENSNVDIAEEFVQLIEAQRGFQANSRVITTTDEILAELVNIVR